MKSGYESEEPLYPISSCLPFDLSLADGFSNVYESPEQIMTHFMNHYTDRSASPSPYMGGRYNYNPQCNAPSNTQIPPQYLPCNRMDTHVPPMIQVPRVPQVPPQAPSNLPPMTSYQTAQYNEYSERNYTFPIIPYRQNITTNINPSIPPPVDINMNMNVSNIAAALPKIWYQNTSTSTSTSTATPTTQSQPQPPNITQLTSRPLFDPLFFNTLKKESNDTAAQYINNNNNNISTIETKETQKKRRKVTTKKEIKATTIKKKKRGRPKKKNNKTIVTKQISKNTTKKLVLQVQETSIPLLTNRRIQIDSNKKYVSTTCSPQRKRSIKNLPCSYCRKHFATNYELKRHLRIHTGERPYQCSLCTKAFKQKQHMITHKKSVHENYRPFKCNVCQKKFKEKGTLTKHVQYTHQVTENTLDCKFCEKSFKRKGNLKCHIKRIHGCQISV